jgi:hypothetical protein
VPVGGAEQHVRGERVAQLLGQLALAAGDHLLVAGPLDPRGRVLQGQGVVLALLAAGQLPHPRGRGLPSVAAPVERGQLDGIERLVIGLGSGLVLGTVGRGGQRKPGQRGSRTGATARRTGRSRVQQGHPCCTRACCCSPCSKGARD